MVKSFYNVFTMVLLAIMASYFGGCAFYLISDTLNKQHDIDQENTFILVHNVKQMPPFSRCITMAYYMLTTLTAIGYGDMSGQSNLEKVILCFVFFAGQIFVVYVLS